MHILVIEDEAKTAAFLRKGLGESGLAVDVCKDGEDGLASALDGEYDAIILDVMLPRLDGWEVLTRLRQRRSSVPIIMLTARDQVPDRVKGLDLGADDYLVKPFAFSELLARLRSLLRRGLGGIDPSTVLVVGDLEVDLKCQKAHRAGSLIRLTAQEYRLLTMLMRHSGEILTRTLLAESVWDMNFDGDTNVVDVAIRRLRAKVDLPFDVPLIHTVHGRGYVLETR